ncbi:hypothetical protein SAMN02910298_02522 [Pseudobutyrivibrio sp. YE44]|uniref:hypothetical protein n=1 Tax=Pseudobutyrivibrio sp. YE44 TaxID=1520802 RepID=UPI0008861231|nr:hypothetical protein [Pseudobutyrivibrio sp. YE44]SDB49849.1 hypothetical protein SAMN02910298_02522 [Pseudobutyrivibrio sp. YE44]
MNVSVTNSLSLRLYYGKYSAFAKGSTRNEATKGTLSMADASALRNAIKKLQDYKFTDSSDTQNQEKLKAFTDAVNNTLTSASKYGKDDTSVRNAASKIKTLNNEYASELKRIGITVQKDGTMSLYESASTTYKSERFQNFFDKDSKYLKDLYDAAKRITRRVDVRI